MPDKRGKPPLHLLTVKPVRVDTFDERDGVLHRRIVAYRMACSCGMVGPSRATVRDARNAFANHAGPAGPDAGTDAATSSAPD